MQHINSKASFGHGRNLSLNLHQTADPHRNSKEGITERPANNHTLQTHRKGNVFRSRRNSQSNLSFQASELITGDAVAVKNPLCPENSFLQEGNAAHDTSLFQSNGSALEDANTMDHSKLESARH